MLSGGPYAEILFFTDPDLSETMKESMIPARYKRGEMGSNSWAKRLNKKKTELCDQLLNMVEDGGKRMIEEDSGRTRNTNVGEWTRD